MGGVWRGASGARGRIGEEEGKGAEDTGGAGEWGKGGSGMGRWVSAAVLTESPQG